MSHDLSISACNKVVYNDGSYKFFGFAGTILLHIKK